MKVFKVVAILTLLSGLLLGSFGGYSQPSRVRELLALADRTVELTQLALQHASFAFFALTVRDAHWHAQSAINILEGPSSPRYDPQYGAQTSSPGAILQAKELVERIRQSEFASDLEAAGNHVVVFLSAADERIVSGRSSQNIAQIRAQVQLGLGFLKAALGCADDPLSIGGARAIQEYLRKRR
ncbi:MAG: hypothetical protein NZ930_02130 [Candidatus Bipolaricaulota bacterium]|nr:hypothetical protein [Candidatus Bipolaricaulota bacterium]MDW8030915.1 hypothetical protein [Candidatus Bipolaricaulota bacterium]